MWLGLASSYGTAAVFFGRFLVPRRRTPELRKVFVCRAEEIPPGESRVVADLRGGTLLLAHTERGFRAIGTRCTHLGCRVHWDPPGKRFVCPCHMGIFDADGKVVSGPPPAPLDRFEVVVVHGMLYVEMREIAS